MRRSGTVLTTILTVALVVAVLTGVGIWGTQKAFASTNTACSTSPSYSHCDGYDPPSSHCGSSYGAYNTGRYAQDYSWLQIWYNPTCGSNYAVINWPNPAPVCGTSSCNGISSVLFFRASASCSGKQLNYCPNNVDKCTTVGACPTGNTYLSWCTGMLSNCVSENATFNGEYIGTTSWWTSFYTDMLYAPNQAVAVCVNFENNSDNWVDYCSDWH